MDVINWWRLVIQAGLIVMPIILTGWLGYRKLWWMLTEYRPHAHVEEKTELLHANGIRYPRNMRDKI